MVLTEEEFLDWKQNDVTIAFFKALKNHREFLKENLIRGSYENEEFVKGKGSALLEITEMKHNEVMEIMNDNK